MESRDLTNFLNWTDMDVSVLNNLPENSGVYVIKLKFSYAGRLRGESDILYIGKAGGVKGLRHRIYFYFKQDQLKKHLRESMLLLQEIMLGKFKLLG